MRNEKGRGICLPEAARHWSATDFADIVRRELQALAVSSLPLQAALTRGSHVDGDDFKVMIVGHASDGDVMRVRAGIFFNSIIAGCSCADDPTPVDSLPEYCELLLTIDKGSGDTVVELAADADAG